MWPGRTALSTNWLEAVLPSDTKSVLESLERRIWKKSPVTPVQLRLKPVVEVAIERLKPGVGGPRAPATPTTKESNCWVVWPFASVAMARKTYLPDERPVVLNADAHVAMPSGAMSGPPGATGAPGATGITFGMAVHGPPPTGA